MQRLTFRVAEAAIVASRCGQLWLNVSVLEYPGLMLLWRRKRRSCRRYCEGRVEAVIQRLLLLLLAAFVVRVVATSLSRSLDHVPTSLTILTTESVLPIRAIATTASVLSRHEWRYPSYSRTGGWCRETLLKTERTAPARKITHESSLFPLWILGA